MTDSIPPGELCERYADLYPGAVTDVLDDFGLQEQTLGTEIDPITDDMQTAGIAYPVVGRPNRSVDDEENIRNMLRMLTDAPADAVLMYATNDDEYSHIGELSVTALQESACRGVVLDGGVRDVRHILEHDFPVFARYKTPADAVPRWELLDWDVGAIVGGVEVQPGDVVVGDVDGVVVVPRDVAGTVLDEAESISETEDAVRTAVRDGVSPLDAYEEYGKF